MLAVDGFTEALRIFVWIVLVLAVVLVLCYPVGSWLERRRERRTWWRHHPMEDDRERPW